MGWSTEEELEIVRNEKMRVDDKLEATEAEVNDLKNSARDDFWGSYSRNRPRFLKTFKV